MIRLKWSVHQEGKSQDVHGKSPTFFRPNCIQNFYSNKSGQLYRQQIPIARIRRMEVTIASRIAIIIVRLFLNDSNPMKAIGIAMI